jgi:two-component system, chemotaxis family, sensor kinase CheA
VLNPRNIPPIEKIFAMDISDDIVKEFLVESYENLDRLDRELIVLEKDPSDREILSSIFRTIHTIKGTSGFLGFERLGSVAHAGENLLGQLRDGELALGQEITNALLAMVDAVRKMLANIEESGAEGERDDRGLIGELTRLQAIGEAVRKETLRKVEADGSGATETAPDISAVPVSIGDILMQRAGVTPAEMLLATEKQREGDPRRLGEILVEQGAAQASDVVDALRVQQAARGQSATDSTIRLDVSLLDRLMNLVGELVLARNQIVQFAGSTEDHALIGASQRLNLITTELQEGVMKTRMQPIGNIWNKLPRTVRDLALACGKQVRVKMEGQETELDKTLIEAIKDPLTHLVRNSVDHGIESPEVRQAAGKNPEGQLQLRAFHEGGQVNIEISDDGAGISPVRIRNKALQKGLITDDQAVRMSDHEILNLVFLPGFSTVEKVTSVSGRGVGMDVVKTHIEKIGGTVDLQSEVGHGATVRMKLPLTLAIIPALMVTSAGQRYAVPQANLRELVGLDREQVRAGIHAVHSAPVYYLRGRLLPLVHLSNALKTNAPHIEEPAEMDSQRHASRESSQDSSNGARVLTAADETPNTCPGDGRVIIVVLEADGRRFGLVVDEVNDAEEIVVKPLGKHLRNINVYAGATILGDGKVALILDVSGLAEASNIGADARTGESTLQTQASADEGTGKQELVLFTDRDGARLAVPLQCVARLENIPATQVEYSGQRWVTQYRGQILPLVLLGEALGGRKATEENCLSRLNASTLSVLVLERERHLFGLVVNQILDVVGSTLTQVYPSTRPGVLHSAVIEDRVTELLDVSALWVPVAGPELANDRPIHI